MGATVSWVREEPMMLSRMNLLRMTLAALPLVLAACGVSETSSPAQARKAADAWIAAARRKASENTSFYFRSTAIGGNDCVPDRVRHRRLHEPAGDVR